MPHLTYTKYEPKPDSKWGKKTLLCFSIASHILALSLVTSPFAAVSAKIIGSDLFWKVSGCVFVMSIPLHFFLSHMFDVHFQKKEITSNEDK